MDFFKNQNLTLKNFNFNFLSYLLIFHFFLSYKSIVHTDVDQPVLTRFITEKGKKEKKRKRFFIFIYIFIFFFLINKINK